MTPTSTHSERGLTLTEVTIVATLALIVMAAIVGFYMNSQAVWIDASTKSITQREATALLEQLSDRVHQSARASVTQIGGDSLVCRLDLYNHGSVTPARSFWWSPEDSLIYEQDIAGGGAAYSVVGSIVEKFQLVPCASCDSLVEVTSLQLRSAQGHRVDMSTQI